MLDIMHYMHQCQLFQAPDLMIGNELMFACYVSIQPAVKLFGVFGETTCIVNPGLRQRVSCGSVVETELAGRRPDAGLQMQPDAASPVAD